MILLETSADMAIKRTYGTRRGYTLIIRTREKELLLEMNSVVAYIVMMGRNGREKDIVSSVRVVGLAKSSTVEYDETLYPIIA